MSYHTPVLLQETIEGLNVSKGKRFIDATFGGGGHGWEIVKAGGELLGIDTDPEAITYAKQRFENREQKTEDRKATIVQGNFRDIDEIARAHGFDQVDGILFDLGVSSHQLDTAPRGFSYKWTDAPFDLRLNQTEGVPASYIINHENEEDLKKIIGVFGEEESCGLIAHALVRSRVKKPMVSTGDVLRVLQAVDGGNAYKTASKVFQAFRIYVNDELASLHSGLEKGLDLVTPGGRIAVISFHSLEDRIVKLFFQRKELKIITRKPIIPKEEEIRINRRSRSAKLRIALKI